MRLAIQDLALVFAAAGKRQHAFAIELVLIEIAGVDVAIRKCERTPAVLPVLLVMA